MSDHLLVFKSLPIYLKGKVPIQLSIIEDEEGHVLQEINNTLNECTRIDDLVYCKSKDLGGNFMWGTKVIPKINLRDVDQKKTYSYYHDKWLIVAKYIIVAASINNADLYRFFNDFLSPGSKSLQFSNFDKPDLSSNSCF